LLGDPHKMDTSEKERVPIFEVWIKGQNYLKWILLNGALAVVERNHFVVMARGG
jgi:hypothetical protein